MQFFKRTVFGFFDGTKKSFIIPVYQRAYAWGEREWATFLDDLKEQIQGRNNYFFGNILLETIEQDRVFEIIDGQQRLTTLTIFIRSIINVLQERINQGEIIEITLSEKESTFLKNSGVVKLRPVDYDRACYDALIVDDNDKFKTASPSQDNIKNAKVWFTKELRKLTSKDIVSILDKIEKTAVTSIEFEGKKDAALMFELQNNRGKDLTNMEKLKSYFLYQLYVNSSPDHTDSNIENIANLFKAIYNLISDIKLLDEDSVLIYHCNTYVNGYDYRTIEDIKIEFKSATDKVAWINSFVLELHTTFSNIKRLERCQDPYYSRLRKLKIPAFVYPFLIKGYKIFDDDEAKLNELLRIMEIVVFRHNVIRSGASINSRINQILLEYDGDNAKLAEKLVRKFNAEHHWSDERFRNTLEGYMYSTPVVNYLLWRYEANIQGKGYVVGSISLDDEQIEHISPQTPPNEEVIASGYEINENGKYSDIFHQKYLNCLGNLMLISGSHNKAIGNIPFIEKLNSYNNNPLLNQQAEIRSFAQIDQMADVSWNVSAIEKRHSTILAFALKEWAYELIPGYE